MIIVKKVDFNKNWRVYHLGDENTAQTVELPHDAMLSEPRRAGAPGGENTGWVLGYDYCYEKNFFVPVEWKDKKIVFEFEGVYRNAEVWINGKKAAEHSYGYTNFYVDENEHLFFGQENKISVIARNADQPNSRWYSGAGIYRPAWLYILPEKHILLNGIRITTLDIKKSRIGVEIKTSAPGKIKVEILDKISETEHIAAEKTGSCDGETELIIDIPEAKLWSVDTPHLYTCRVSFGEDVQEEYFGIREISCDAKTGFCINGERIILRGACIHHDNGLLGAAAHPFAEERKVRILKDAGYNALRMAHNPCSKAMLSACDRLGMLVMDEYADMWYIHKTRYDYAKELCRNWKRDLADMVNKDYNHPSVIMYSIGNEVSETAQPRGIALCGEMREYLHKMDSRPVTCGINIFFNFLSKMGLGVYSDKKARQEKKQVVGSDFFNRLAGWLGADFMKFGAELHGSDMATKDAFLNLDVAGYNYGINRYEKDLKMYPERVIVGTETFCADAYRFTELARKNPALIGDFVWAGMDYLGEVGIGAWEYTDYAPLDGHGPGWVSAGSGRIDLTGKPLAEMAYTRVAFGLSKIKLAVVPVYAYGRAHTPSAWKFTNAIESWSWNGCDGMKTQVEVYARADFVKLYVNKKCVGKKKLNGDCRVVFKTKYYDGNVIAVAFNKDKKEIARCRLDTAGEETVLTLEPEKIPKGTVEPLLYLRMRYTDRRGNLKPLARGRIKLKVEGGKLLGIGSACPFYPDGYQGDTADTYYGEALAIIKPDGEKNINIFASSPYGDAEVTV
jgi:beta-galactosidase